MKSQPYNVLKKLSTFFFAANYAGLIYKTLTLRGDSDEQIKVSHST
jgi:hypothetical protein